MPAMTQQERAKLFMPFDAMKGLSEELRKREERHTRISKIELSEESLEELSGMIMSLDRSGSISQALSRRALLGDYGTRTKNRSCV